MNVSETFPRLNRFFFFAGLLIGIFGFFSRAAAQEGTPEWLYENVAPTPQPPDGREPVIPENFAKSSGVTSSLAGPITPSATQPVGSLTGRIVFMSCGHGWTYGTAGGGQFWRLQRGVGNLMNEDAGNLDQLNLFALYCFNAGATVVPFRPIGRQTNEVVLDNVSPSVAFAGAWSDTANTSYFYGSPGQVGYRFTSLAASETATATYTPTIPLAGFYPVYTWVRHGSDRALQLYRIRHTGGEAQVRIPHYMVGNGWVFLGEYYFNAGSNAANGSVVISNLRSTTNGNVVIADAIRFGNGMGSIDRGGGVSGYPREEECTRYWANAGIGVGMPSSLYDSGSHDESDSWITPSKMSAEMNNGPSKPPGTTNQLDYKRVHISFHSNAADGSARGVTGLITSDPTPNQTRLAQICSTEVNSDLLGLGAPPLEIPWANRGSTYSGGYSEIDGSYFNYEMDATIIEVAFHDNTNDAKLLRDPKARNAVARASYQAVVKYMNEFDTADPVPLTFLPEPPNNPRAVAVANGTTLSWSAPVNQSGSSSPTNYIIYTSTNGYGFGNPVSVGNVLSYIFTNLATDTDFYFRIVAANAGGQSFPAEVVGCRRSSIPGAPKVLFVNAFTRFDRTQNLLQPTGAQNYKAPGNSGTIERVEPRANNSFDYVVQHGQAMSAANQAFDSCLRVAVTNGTVKLTNYPIVIWAAGQELANPIDAVAQNLISVFLQNGGGLFVSGSEIAGNLGRASSPAASRTFLQNQLHATLASDAHTNSGSYTVTAPGAGIFTGMASGTIDNGTNGIYWVKSPEILTPAGVGASAALNYSGGLGGAGAIQYDGSAGGGRVVYFGFPFETVSVAARRNSYMAAILDFLNVPPPAGSPEITSSPASRTINRFADTTFDVAATGEAPLFFQWRYNGANIPNETNNTLTLSPTTSVTGDIT
ncbi:MAG: N-acetylmuramoyl-L-alanine amidase, partial [Verrucomicrobiota bacterium]